MNEIECTCCESLRPENEVKVFTIVETGHADQTIVVCTTCLPMTDETTAVNIVMEALENHIPCPIDVIEAGLLPEEETGEPNWQYGTIAGIDYTNGSGCITLVMEGGKRVTGDNGVTVRALEAMFGDVIGVGHTFNTKGLTGKKIKYVTAEWSDTFMEYMDVDD